ncbi:hypothetical protein SUGI_0251010 [Cryptomeria japonica]|nr:hypothetical protein SUGI_0251010 [Cryptomeria japonica]
MDAYREFRRFSVVNRGLNLPQTGFVLDNRPIIVTNQHDPEEDSTAESNISHQSFVGSSKNLYPNQHVMKKQRTSDIGMTFQKNNLFPEANQRLTGIQMDMEGFSQSNIPFQNPNGNNQQCLPRVESIRTPTGRSGKRIPWSLNETRDLVKLRVEMDKDFKLNKKKHQPLWEHISCVLNSLYPSCQTTAITCSDKWKNTRREYIKLKNCGKPMEDYFKIMDMLENTKSNNPAEAIGAVTWTLAEICKLVECRLELDPKFRSFQHYHKDIWEELSNRLHKKLNLATSDKNPTVCSEKWRSIVKEYKQMKIEGKPIEGYMELVQILAENCKCIVIQYGTNKHQIAIHKTATVDDIKLAIKTVCGLQNHELPFWLEDQNGIAQPIDKAMPGNKVYNLRLVR